MNKNITPELREYLSKDLNKDVRAAVFEYKNLNYEELLLLAASPNTDAETLKALSENRSLRKFVSGNPNTPDETLEELELDNDLDVRAGVAGNPNAPEKILKARAGDKDWEVRVALARNPSVPEETLEYLSYDLSSRVRGAVVNNPKIKSDILVRLALDKNINVLWHIANKVSAPEAALIILAHNEKSKIREAVAANPNATPKILAELSKDEIDTVRDTVAGNKNTPADILIELAKDKNMNVRRSLAYNPATPDAILGLLLKDKTEDVKWAAEEEIKDRKEQAEIDAAKEAVSKMSLEERREKAMDLKTSAAVLRVLAQDEYIAIRRKVAENENTPPWVLSELAEDTKDEVVKIRVAHNKKSPPEILIKLSKDNNWYIRSSVAGNEKTPEKVLRNLADDETWGVRHSVVGNKRTPKDVLEKMKGDESETVRYVVGKALEELNKDHSLKTPLEAEGQFAANVSDNSFAGQSKSESVEQEIKDKNPHIAQIRDMFIKTLEADKMPFNKEIKDGETEIPYEVSNQVFQMFERSNVVAAALHMAAIGSNDPRYYSEEYVKKRDELKEGALPLKTVWRMKDGNCEYKEQTQNYYNASELKVIDIYHKPEAVSNAGEVVEAKRREAPETQLEENMIKWQVAAAKGRSYKPPKTEFTNQDYIGVIRGLSENRLAFLCYESSKEAEKILEQNKNKIENKIENKLTNNGGKYGR